MLLLIVFGFVAGAATALSPCVLPVLPVALSAGATGGRRRPLGVVTGLVLSFTFATIALVYVISALGLPDDPLRSLAIVMLVGFGLALIVPRLAAWVEVGVRDRSPTPGSLYYYAHETAGQVRCHTVDLNGGLWWVIGPNGKSRR